MVLVQQFAHMLKMTVKDQKVGHAMERFSTMYYVILIVLFMYTLT